jgi:hypothetical protein
MGENLGKRWSGGFTLIMNTFIFTGKVINKIWDQNYKKCGPSFS